MLAKDSSKRCSRTGTFCSNYSVKAAFDVQPPTPWFPQR